MLILCLIDIKIYLNSLYAANILRHSILNFDLINYENINRIQPVKRSFQGEGSIGVHEAGIGKAFV